MIVSGKRAVLEAHLVLYLQQFRWITEAAYADEDRSKDHDGNINTPRIALANMVSFGLSSELNWMLIGSPRQVGKIIMPTQSLSWGQLELGMRYDRLDLGKHAKDVKDGGSEGGSLLIKWYWSHYASLTFTMYDMRYVFAPIEEENTLSSLGFWIRHSIYWGF